MQVVSRFKAAGWRPVVAAELEFSLVTWDRDIPAHTCPLPRGQRSGGRQYLRIGRSQPP